jgi:hypothetical protein
MWLEVRVPIVRAVLRTVYVGHGVAADHGVVGLVLAGIGANQQRVEVEVVEVLAAAADLGQQVGATDDFQQALEAQAGQDLADLFGDEREEVDDLFRRAGELGA